MDDILWESFAKIGGVITIVGFAIRWVYTIERDMIRRYARQIVELEIDNKECRKEAAHWRNAYWDLREAAYRAMSQGKRALPPVPQRDPTMEEEVEMARESPT